VAGDATKGVSKKKCKKKQKKETKKKKQKTMEKPRKNDTETANVSGQKKAGSESLRDFFFVCAGIKKKIEKNQSPPRGKKEAWTRTWEGDGQP